MNVPESATETTMGETAVTLWSYRTFEAILATDGHHSLAYSFALVAVRWKALMRDVLEVCRKASDTPIFRRRR